MDIDSPLYLSICPICGMDNYTYYYCCETCNLISSTDLDLGDDGND